MLLVRAIDRKLVGFREEEVVVLTALANAIQTHFENAKCSQLQQELLNLVRFRQDTANRLIALAKRQNPGQSERWYLEKVIWDLKRGR